ncbi:O-methyltransferase [Azospirillum sp. ST 5-10]|uniref:O-methyltransferase n=1 Tax=unclassified Azospirillum TaxID=2630922 RepID=UPI003F4A8547
MTDQRSAPTPPTLCYGYESGLCWMVMLTDGVLGSVPDDTMEHPFRSPLRVLEDGRPLAWPHAPHTEIRSCGGGRYSHWASTVRFSTSDNSNPLTNGRTYELEAGSTRVRLAIPAEALASPQDEGARRFAERMEQLRQNANDVHVWFTHAGGFCWKLDLARLAAHHGRAWSDREEVSMVVEDGKPLPATDDLPERIADLGGGRWSVDADRRFLFLSSLANDDPKLNGASYAVRIGGDWLAIPQSLAARALASVPDRTVAPQLVAMIRDAHCLGAEWRTRRPFETEYYPFLAGLAQLLGARRILEIGSERGGSAEAMLLGMGAEAELLVTVDVVDQAPRLDDRQGVVKIIDDAASDRAVQRVLAAFGHRPIDLLFVDSAHEYAATLQHIAIYTVLLRPRVIVVDDIVLNESMARLWGDLRRALGDRAVNACDVEPRIRNCDCGLGLAVLIDWPEWTVPPRAAPEQEI